MVKRETTEDVYAVVLQGPCDMVKATLLEAQSPVVQYSAPRYHAQCGAVVSIRP